MDYSQLSDFEINKLVAICIHPDIKNWNCYDVSGRSCFVINEGTPKRLQYGFSFTSDPADAWPIIVGSKINIRFGAEGLACEAQFMQYGHESVECYHANPLRAAMIVFLMMQDTTHA